MSAGCRAAKEAEEVAENGGRGEAETTCANVQVWWWSYEISRMLPPDAPLPSIWPLPLVSPLIPSDEGSLASLVHLLLFVPPTFTIATTSDIFVSETSPPSLTLSSSLFVLHPTSSRSSVESARRSCVGHLHSRRTYSLPYLVSSTSTRIYP